MPLQAYFAAPREHGVGGELGAVVTDDHGWLAALGDQFVQLSHNPPPGDRCVGHRTQTLPGHVIDNIEHARSEEHTSELQSLMRNSYAVFCLKKKTTS